MLDRLTPVVFDWNGRKLEGEVVAFYPEFHNAYRVRRSENEYIVQQSEVLTVAEYERQKKKQRLELEREEYKDIIEAWDRGCCNVETIAQHLGCSRRGLHQRITAAKRRGFLK